jgi:hypothetical protein
MTIQNSACQTSIPEFPDVTVNQTIIQFDGSEGLIRQELLSLDINNQDELSGVPVSAASVHLSVNGVIQRQNADYTVNGQTITLLATPPEGSSVVAYYMSTSGSTSSVPVGTILANGSDSLPSGFLVCNGDSYPIEGYELLYAAIGVMYGVGDDAPNTFNVPDMTMPFYTGDVLETRPAIIRYT